MVRVLPLIEDAPLAFVASAGAPPFAAALAELPGGGGGLLLVGPEGDFTEDEMEKFMAAGAVAVGLGPRRLRVETAAMAMLAALMLDQERRKETG